ncbi:MAG: hypothetical protein LWX11_02725 [Firmicutes bacterium]|nr:hypothetical protein [Bacillota bacterium]
MSLFSLKPTAASLVWLEPRRVVAGGRTWPVDGPPNEAQLAAILQALPPGPTSWVVEDLWAPSLLARDIVALPSGTEAQDTFFRWKFNGSLALDTPHTVQALALDDGAWLLAGIPEDLRETWIQTALRLGRPIHRLTPRWLTLYNRLAPGQDRPGLLLSLCPQDDGYTGTLAAWGRTLTLLRQWTDPADLATWASERVEPTVAYLHRESRTPQEIWVWGAPHWPDGDIPHRLLPSDIPAQESL